MRMTTRLGVGVVAILAGQAMAQPIITSLGNAGGGTKPVNVTDAIGGTVYVGAGSGYWTLNGGALTFVSTGSGGGGELSEDAAYQSGIQLNDGITGGGIPRVFGNTATGVSPPFSNTPTLAPSTTQPAATESIARRYNRVANTWQGLGGLPIVGDLHVFGSSSSGGSTGAFLNPLAMSSDGRFLGGQGYACTYSSSAGTTISASTFRWRPWIWDAQANGGLGGMTVLSTPFNTGSNTWRRRDGVVYGISTDGTVICGAQVHNVATGLAADPDGARPVVWRWNSTTSQYDFSFLPGGDNGAGQYYTIALSFGSMHMNNAGTVIIGRSVDVAGSVFIAKWVWNSGTNSWDAPINIGYSLTAAPSWLPAEITACGAGTVVPSFNVTGLSEDGNTIFGYSEWKCGSNFPMRGGWIWRSTDPVMRDWYDYLNGLGVAGVAPGGPWGPIGDNGDNSKNQPVVGFPVDVSPDGNTFVGFHSANQMIIGAPPWILQNVGGPSCVSPVITANPSNVTYSLCSFGSTLSSIILNANAAGTLPITYQWYKDGSPLSDGPSVGGGTITGAASIQLRVNTPGPADAGGYHCVATGCTGATATTTTATVVFDPAVIPPSNDTCLTASAVGEGTHNFNPCGATVDDGASNCLNLNQVEIADVWYQYTPTFTGEARFQTCASSFDTTLQILDACNGGALACNNDVGTRGLAGLGASCGSNRSVISRFAVTAGVPVWVRVGCISMPFANSGTSGALVISQAPPAPANDLCSNATVVDLGTHAFNLSEATEDFDFGTAECSTPVDSATTSNRDVFFRFTSACGGVYSFTTCGLASPNITNPMLHIMTPDCTGVSLVCDDNTSGCAVGGSQQAQITGHAMAAGETVVIRVSQSGTGSPGTNALSGTGQLNITGTSNCGACCNGTTCTTTLPGDCTGTFQGAGTVCGPVGNPTTCCPANFNGVGGVTVQDIFDFLAGYFSGAPQADFNQSGGISVQDIFDFLAAYFTGCA